MNALKYRYLLFMTRYPEDNFTIFSWSFSCVHSCPNFIKICSVVHAIREKSPGLYGLTSVEFESEYKEQGTMSLNILSDLLMILPDRCCRTERIVTIFVN